MRVHRMCPCVFPRVRTCVATSQAPSPPHPASHWLLAAALGPGWLSITAGRTEPLFSNSRQSSQVYGFETSFSFLS